MFTKYVSGFFTIVLVLFNFSCDSTKDVGELNSFSKNSQLDSVFINYDFELAENTENKVFQVKKNGKFGWMNIEGEWLIPCQYEWSSPQWIGGLNVCKNETSVGVINFQNDTIIPFNYYNVSFSSDDLIEVENKSRLKAYFSKEGKQLTEFKKRLPEFLEDLAIISSNSKELLNLYIGKGETPRQTDIHSSDFVVVNKQFDTLLQFNQVEFLLEFGSLKNNRRSFFIYPHAGLHADRGLKYGQYGYLDENGSIIVEPKFRASDVFLPVLSRQYRNPDCPFYSNLSLVRELDNYYFIDTSGNKVFDLNNNGERVYHVSDFNEFGVAGYRSDGDGVTNSSKINLIDTTGKIIHESYERDAAMSCSGARSNSPPDFFIPISDWKAGLLKIYSPDFKQVSVFPLFDSIDSTKYNYKGFEEFSFQDYFVLIQMERSDFENRKYPLKRLIDSNQDVLSSWFPNSSVLSIKYGNFTLKNKKDLSSKLYDFDKNVLYQCDSCNFVTADYGIVNQGIYKVRLSDGNFEYVNFRGKVLSTLFDSMEGNIIDLTEQISNYNKTDQVLLNCKEEDFERIFLELNLAERLDWKNKQKK